MRSWKEIIAKILLVSGVFAIGVVIKGFGKDALITEGASHGEGITYYCPLRLSP
jgi:hypothetical protein